MNIILCRYGSTGGHVLLSCCVEHGGRNRARYRNSETSSCTNSCRAWRAKSCLSLVTYRETSDGMENKSRMKCVYKIYEVHAPQIKSKCTSLTTFHYQIYVKTLTDKTFILDVEPSDTIAKSGAYPPINSVLFLRGRSYGMDAP